MFRITPPEDESRARESPHRFEGRSSARAWLPAVARRAVADSHRYTAVRPRTADVPDWQLTVERAQPRGLPGSDEGIVLLGLLDRLPQERREAFVLTQLLGLPYTGAAALGDCPVGTVRFRVARARTTLAALVVEAEEATTAVRRPVMDRESGDRT